MNRLNRFCMMVVAPAFIGLLCACAQEDIVREHVATVNGEKIYLDEYRGRLSMQKGILSPRAFQRSINKRELLEDELLDAIILERLILQQADRLDLSISKKELEKKIEEIQKDYGDNFTDLLASVSMRYDDWREQVRRDLMIAAVIDREVTSKIMITNMEIEDFFNDHPKFCATEARVHAWQIVVHDEEKAHAIKDRLNSGEDFSKLAREASIGPEAAKGGDLGMVYRESMPDPLDGSLFALPKGAVSNVIKSVYGYHILMVTNVFPARERNLADCREDIVAALTAQKEEASFFAWLEILKAKAEISKEPNLQKKLRKPTYPTGRKP